VSLISGLQSMFFGPAGTFTRSRRDCMVKSQMFQQTGGGGLATDTWDMYLFNNDNLGRYLALYGLWVFNVNADGFDLLTNMGYDTSFGAGPGVPTMLDQQTGPGLIAAGLNSSFGFISDIFFPFGPNGFQLVLDTPIVIIPPGWSIDVQTYNQAKGSNVTMLWAPY
jgi:hypothetical protein